MEINNKSIFPRSSQAAKQAIREKKSGRDSTHVSVIAERAQLGYDYVTVLRVKYRQTNSTHECTTYVTNLT